MLQKMLILTSFFSFILFSPVEARANEKDFVILSPMEIVRVIGRYPAPGSVTEAQEVETLLRYQENRNSRDCELAGSQELPTIGSLFGGKNGPLRDDEVYAMTKELAKHYGEAVTNAYVAKKLFGRPRPFTSFPEIEPCVALEKSESYPSGHATLARVLARLLSKKYPERARAFMKLGNQAGLNRIVGGVHYPSDVEAGMKLGDYLAQKIIERSRRNYDR